MIGGEEDRSAARMVFCIVERIVGAFVELFTGIGGVRRTGKANRSPELHLRFDDIVRLSQRHAHRQANYAKFRIAAFATDNDAEFITAKPRDTRKILGQCAQAAANLNQHLITRAVAVSIIDALESVKIKYANCHPLTGRRGLRQTPIKLRKKPAAIGKLGQAIRIGEVNNLIMEPLKL